MELQMDHRRFEELAVTGAALGGLDAANSRGF